MDYVLSLSYGKDSLACLGAIEELGWQLDRIVHAEVWATDTIPADLPPMVEFKAKADRIIKERWGLEVQHIRTKQTAESVFYHKRTRGNRIGEIVGWPMTKGPKVGCELQKALKVRPMQTAQKGAITYLGIAVDEPGRYNNISETKLSPLIEAGWTEAHCRQWCEERVCCPRSTRTAHAAGAGSVQTRALSNCGTCARNTRNTGKLC